jgi:uncharacterized SAM-binding protein YcdF (DUF218 family)
MAWHDRISARHSVDDAAPVDPDREAHDRGRGVRTIGRYVGGLLLVAVLIVGGVALRIVQVGQTDERTSADAIVVLGAAQYDGDPSPVFQARLDHAAELYRQGTAPHILTIGGGQTGDRTTEGAAGAAYLAELGIDPSALTAVGSGDDTLASLRAAEVLLAENGWHSVVLVTDPWHAARSRMMAQDLGMNVRVSPVQEGPSVRAGTAPRYVLRETLGVLYYRLTGGSSGVGTAVM